MPRKRGQPTKMQRGQAKIDHAVAAGRAAIKTPADKRTPYQKKAVKRLKHIAPGRTGTKEERRERLKRRKPRASGKGR